MSETNLKMYLLISALVLFVRTTRFASFPDHLVIQIKKFTFGLDWVPKKLGEHRYYLNCCWRYGKNNNSGLLSTVLIVENKL